MEGLQQPIRWLGGAVVTNCLDCTHISRTKGGNELARLGFVGCAQKPAGWTRSVSSDAACVKFSAGLPDAVAKNRKWAGGLKP